MFTAEEVDTILDALHDAHDECEHLIDNVVGPAQGFDPLNPRRIAVQVRMTKIENVIGKITRLGRS